jgi:hypothetical protein
MKRISKMMVAATLMLLCVSFPALASRYDGMPCGGTYSYNEPIDKLARDAGPHGVTWLSDTSIRVTDATNPRCSITVNGLPASSDAGTGGGSPAASSSIAVNKIIRQTVFTQARPRSEQRRPAPPAPAPDQPTPKQPFYESMPNVGRLNSGAADAFYNKWEVGSLEGQTFGINPSATWGETYDITLTLPLHIISPKDGDTVFGIGLDGAFKYPFTGKWENFMAGIHFYGMGFFGGDDTASTFGGGPFVGYSYRINPDWIVSGGLLLEMTKPNEGDSITEIVPALNLGYNVTDNVALNAYLIHYKNLDSDVSDDAYTDIGADVAWVRGTWSLSAGIKTATGLKNVKSTEVYIGSNWMF